MKVLFVCSGNSGKISPFIEEQTDELQKQGVQTSYFLVQGKGIFGYLRNLGRLLRQVKIVKPDIIHAHYGLSGLLAGLQRSAPVVVTYHGSDINSSRAFNFSKLAMRLAKKNIFVSTQLLKKANCKDGVVIPCGVDIELFKPRDKYESRSQLGLSRDKKYILFSSAFDRAVKNYSLARAAVDALKDDNIELLELKGYNRAEVAILMNAVDVALLTSHSEGSPQFTKEAIACGCPIVSTDVGDVRAQIEGLQGCYITSFNTQDVSKKIKLALLGARISNNFDIRKYDGRVISERIIEIYKRL